MPTVFALESALWPAVAAAPRRLLVVPVGSLEQHGPHLPLETDTRIAVAVARRACAGQTGVALAPPLAIGASGEHADFPGTLSIGTAALTLCLVELGRHASLHWPAVLLVNGHGGNTEAIEAATRQLADEGRVCRAWHATVPARGPADGGAHVDAGGAHVDAGGAHAGRAETSLMLALAPDQVRMAAAQPGEIRPLAEIMPLLRERGVAALSRNGVLGDPAGASAAEGEALLADMTRDLTDTIRRLLG